MWEIVKAKEDARVAIHQYEWTDERTGKNISGPVMYSFLSTISDLTNNCIWFLNREDGKVLGHMGSMGQNGGYFYGLHMEAVDSKGAVYTGEVFAGERVQRFLPAR